MINIRQLREEMRIKQEVYAKKTITTRQYRERVWVRVCIKKHSDPDQRQQEAKKTNDQGRTNVWQVPQGFHQIIS